MIHGIFEINAISLISANETERYKALQHEEYAGLDLEGHEGAILPDLDNDGVPDEWPFSFGDLLLALSGEQSFPSGLRFMAKFDEGSGNVVLDDVQGLKGKLKGNATWSAGKDGKGSIRFEPNNIKTFGIEVGHLNISNTIDQGVVETINFKNVYENPVVVAYIYTRNNGESLDVRIDNVTSTSCQIFMEEPPDGAVTYTTGHPTETVAYMVVEAGEWKLDDGTEIKAGTISTNKYYKKSTSDTWETISFSSAFSTSNPVILHSLNTYNNGEWTTTAVKNVGTSSFDITQELAEASGTITTETIGWIAIESGKTGIINDIKYETGSTTDGDSDGVDNNGHVITFTQSFDSAPLIVVKQDTHNGGDGGWARGYGTHSSTQHSTCTEEDQATDSERSHTDERFGFLAFSSPFDAKFILKKKHLKLEVGQVNLTNTIDQGIVETINFKNLYADPVVVAYILSRNEGESLDVRIDNVTSTSCQIFMEEPPDGAVIYTTGHPTETVAYMVMESGEWTLEDGTEVKAGTISTNKYYKKSTSNTWETISFSCAFSTSNPVILHSLNTYNNGEWTTSAVKNVGTSSFQLTQELAEASGTITTETIGWIAIESGKMGTINGVKYETGSSTDGNNDGVDNDGHTISFSQNFTKSPLILVKQDTHNGGDGGWARGYGTHSSTQHLTCTEEDQASDSERSHTDERFGFWAIESPVKIDKSQNFTRVEFGDVLDDALGDSRDEFVITAWVYPLSLNNSARSDNGIENIFFTKQGIIELGIDAEGRLQAYLNAQNKEATGIYGVQGAIQLNAWTYIAVRYNKSDVDVYIGDEWYREAIGSIAEPWSGGGNLKEGGNLTIGSDMISGIIFNGSIDEVSVFNGSISDIAIEEHAGPEIIKVSCSVLKEDGTGNWTPITTNGDVQEGYLNFYSNVSKNDVDWLAFYLTETEPDLLNPDESSWYMIANFTTNEDEYYFLMDSWDIPDNDSWYLSVKCRDA
ncbi:MAG: LamG domain-containing protein, partial [Candidatus Helarchaeales archaeon]